MEAEAGGEISGLRGKGGFLFLEVPRPIASSRKEYTEKVEPGRVAERKVVPFFGCWVTVLQVLVDALPEVTFVVKRRVVL